MNVIRFPIAWLMAIVAIAALDFGAIRAASDIAAGTNVLLCMVGLPMANLLTIGLLIGQRHRESRQFLFGFEAFGIGALAFLIKEILCGQDWMWSYLRLVIEPLTAAIRMTGWGEWSRFGLPVGRFFLSLWATLPQLAFALIGGYLVHWFGTAERRGQSCS